MKPREPGGGEEPATVASAGLDLAVATLLQLAGAASGAAVRAGDPPAARAEPSLRLAEARYRALIEQIPAVTFTASLEGGLSEIYVSPQIESLLGFTQEEWRADPVLWFRQIHPADRAQLAIEFADACTSGRPFRGIVRVHARDGGIVWVHGEARFVLDEAGRPLFLQGIAFDVTEQQRAEQTRRQLIAEKALRLEGDRERDRLQEMFSNLPAAIALLRGPSHIVDFLNPAALELADDAARAIGRPWREVFPDFPGEAAVVLDTVFATGTTRGGTEWVCRGGRHERELYFNFVCQPLRDRGGTVTGVLTHAVDVTEQVSARRLVENALRLREDFISVAAHELRNPVNALVLTLHAIALTARQTTGGITAEWLAARLQKAQRQVERLNTLVESLLDVSRISAGRIHLQIDSLDFDAVVRDTVENFRAGHPELTPTITAEGPISGRSDRLRLEQVLTNLLSNAIKYGAGKPIEIEVSRHGECARLRVRDHGIGITPADRARIFDKFERAVPTRRYKGLGLGLWITRQIVEALGGRIGVESEPGKGSTFTVDLPLQAPQDDSRASGGLEILAVDDERDMLDTLADILRAAGHQVTCAGNGREALARLRRGLRPDVILLDLSMPVMDGWEFRLQQMQDPALRTIPVIVTSANSVGRDPAMDGVIVVGKPIDVGGLLDRLARVGRPIMTE